MYRYDTYIQSHTISCSAKKLLLHSFLFQVPVPVPKKGRVPEDITYVVEHRQQGKLKTPARTEFISKVQKTSMNNFKIR
jgi:hypothetical protein